MRRLDAILLPEDFGGTEWYLPPPKAAFHGWTGDAGLFVSFAVMGSVHKFDYGHKSGERRRHTSWPEALRREIVAASLATGTLVALVADVTM
jgi:hypothetical protein